MKRKIYKLPRVYTNPPQIDRGVYHTFNQNSMRQVDQRQKLCYECDSKADVTINNKYYCARHGLKKVI